MLSGVTSPTRVCDSLRLRNSYTYTSAKIQGIMEPLEVETIRWKNCANLLREFLDDEGRGS